MWFCRTAEDGHSGAQYALAKLLLEQSKTDETLPWHEQATEDGNQLAVYSTSHFLPQNSCESSCQASFRPAVDEMPNSFRYLATVRRESRIPWTASSSLSF